MSVVPFAGQYVLAREVRGKKTAAAQLAATAALWAVTSIYLAALAQASREVMPARGASPYAGALAALSLLSLALGAAVFALNVYVAHGVSRAFGHGAGFTCGLELLGAVFYGVLAFSADEARSRRDERHGRVSAL